MSIAKTGDSLVLLALLIHNTEGRFLTMSSERTHAVATCHKVHRWKYVGLWCCEALKDLVNRYKMYLIHVSFIFASPKLDLPAMNLFSVM